jgi:hypothetical protein
MAQETPIINIFTYKLPYDLANQIYNEFQARLVEVKYLIEVAPSYKVLKKELEVIELLLALSIFHKRVVANLDAAIKFHKTVSEYGKVDTVRLGQYDFTGTEKNQLLSLVLNYRALIAKYGIPTSFMDYYETKEFLKNVKDLKEIESYGNDQKEKGSSTREDDLPF